MYKRMIRQLSWLFLVFIIIFRTEGNDIGNYIGNGIFGLDKKNFNVAISNLNVEIQNNPTNPTPRILRVGIFIQEGKYNEALADCNKLIAENDNLTAYAFRGYAYYGKEDYDKAIADFDKCISIKPITAIFLIRAGAYEKKNDYDKAIGDYGEIIGLNRNNANSYTIRGRCYIHVKNNDKAIDDFNQAVRIDPTNSLAYSSRGFAWSEKGDYDKAIADLNQSLRFDSKNAETCNNLAWIFATAPDQKFRDGQKALLYANRACELSAWNDPYSIGTLAAAYAENGDFDNAVKWGKKNIEFSLSKKDLKAAQERLVLYQQKKPYRIDK